jgi:RimJ/RimL family protein N-acetyltransferase
MLFTRRRPEAVAPAERESPRVLARGERTVVREFERADVDRWMAWPRHRDPLFEGYNAPLLNVRQRDMYHQQRIHSPDAKQFSVDDLSGDFIGRISIREIDWRLGASVLGVSFHPERLNKGLGTDALWAFQSYYFGPLNMNVLFLDVAAFNVRAFRVYEKCGFRRCGERWGEPQTDSAGIFRKAEYREIRHLFQWEYGMVRPLLWDMAVRREEWVRLRDQLAGIRQPVNR